MRRLEQFTELLGGSINVNVTQSPRVTSDDKRFVVLIALVVICRYHVGDNSSRRVGIGSELS
jgi:hypothetical protein